MQSEKGIPTIPGKSRGESKDKERKHKKHKDKDRDKEHKKHKHRHKDRSKDKDREKKKDKSGHHDSGGDHSKRHHEKVLVLVVTIIFIIFIRPHGFTVLLIHIFLIQKRKHEGNDDSVDNHKLKKSKVGIKWFFLGFDFFFLVHILL